MQPRSRAIGAVPPLSREFSRATTDIAGTLSGVVTQRLEPERDRCAHCGEPLGDGHRANQSYCNAAHRAAAGRARSTVPAPRGMHWADEVQAPLRRRVDRHARWHEVSRQLYWRHRWPDLFDRAETQRLEDEFRHLENSGEFPPQVVEKSATAPLVSTTPNLEKPMRKPQVDEPLPYVCGCGERETWDEYRYLIRSMQRLISYEGDGGKIRKWPVAWDRDPSLIPEPEERAPGPVELVTMVHFSRIKPDGVQGDIRVPRSSVPAYETLGWQTV